MKLFCNFKKRHYLLSIKVYLTFLQYLFFLYLCLSINTTNFVKSCNKYVYLTCYNLIQNFFIAFTRKR